MVVRSSAPGAPRDAIAWPSDRVCLNSSAPAVEGFGRHRRLLSPKDYADTFATRKQLRGNLFVLHYRHNDGAEARLGLVVPKKQAKRAILRNAIKRQARESFRRRCSGLPAMDLILRLAQPVKKDADGRIDKTGWKTEIEGLLERLRGKQAS